VAQPKIPAGWTTWAFWQYSESGSVPGIQGPVDLDVFNGPLPPRLGKEKL
jgi:lysozyme